MGEELSKYIDKKISEMYNEIERMVEPFDRWFDGLTTGVTTQIKEPEVWIDAQDGDNSWMSYGHIHNSTVIGAVQQVIIKAYTACSSIIKYYIPPRSSQANYQFLQFKLI